MRTTFVFACLLAAALFAAPAEGKLVYVKQADTASPAIYVATNAGKNPRRLGIGRAPTISPDGQFVAFITMRSEGSQTDTVVLQRLESGSQRLVMRSEAINSLRFSPDSTKLAAIAGGKRVRVYDLTQGRLHSVAAGNIRGYSFSPDGEQLVYGQAEKSGFTSASDLYLVPALGGDETRLTEGKNAINPVWGGGGEIFFDRFKRRKDDAPAYQLWAVNPAAPETLRRLTNLTIPPLTSGLVPLETSANGKRMLAAFTGQDVEVGFTVATATGQTRALSRDFESGTVGFDLSADGETILAHTGGPDPGAMHDVVTVPYGRSGKTKVLVEDAAYPDWSR